jgi:hypothetical protein
MWYNVLIINNFRLNCYCIFFLNEKKNNEKIMKNDSRHDMKTKLALPNVVNLGQYAGTQR